jgi:hypothetical protein
MSTEMNVPSEEILEKQFQVNLLRGQRFQDYCCLALWHLRKTPICNFQSHVFQKHFGENLQKEEFKCDERSIESSNLFVETKERVLETQELHPAGIYQRDNAIRFTIGNYDEIWRFSKKKLIELHKSGQYREVPVKNPETGVVTAEGFLLPKADADKYCEDCLKDLKATKLGQFIPDDILRMLSNVKKITSKPNDKYKE